MSGQSCFGDFEQDALPHRSTVYHFARWLTGNEPDAEDITQEAYLRAFRFHHRFRGGDARSWLLAIVRNVYYTWLRQYPAGRLVNFDEDPVSVDPYFANPEEVFIQKSGSVLLRRALETLPTGCREMLILRELDGMSYKQISIVVGVPTGTVMSRLSRARARLRQSVAELTNTRRETERED